MTKSSENRSPTAGDFLEAIGRSGYLLESQVSQQLSTSGFFVETNQMIKDPLTGKGREIDLLAEYYSDQPRKERAAASIKFVAEIKNNSFPLVVLTSLPFSPNADTWEALREVVTAPKGIEWPPIEQGFFDKLVGYQTKDLYTQYCSFKRKKDASAKSELMALHPEEFHDGLQKVVQYCDEQVEFWSDRPASDYFRDFLFLPMFVLGGDLLELQLKPSSKPQLKRVPFTRFFYNYHWKDQNRSAIVWFVTILGLAEFLTNMISIERSIETDMCSKLVSIRPQS